MNHAIAKKNGRDILPNDPKKKVQSEWNPFGSFHVMGRVSPSFKTGARDDVRGDVENDRKRGRIWTWNYAQLVRETIKPNTPPTPSQLELLDFLGIDSLKIYNEMSHKKAYLRVQRLITIQMVNKRRKGLM